MRETKEALENVSSALEILQEGMGKLQARVKSMLDKIGNEITAFSKMFPVESSLANFTIFLNDRHKVIESFYPQVDQMDFYRWIACVTLLCTVVLILAFNMLGLLCGTCGYNKQASPTTRGCLSNTGGNLLMAYVDLKDISLLDRASRDNLMNFANSGVGEIDYPDYLAEVNKGVTVVDLLSFCSDLEDQADQLPRGALENALKGHASSIRAIHREQVVPLEQAMVKVTNILTAIDAAEYLITHNASHVVKQLTAEVAQCKPISNMVDSMEIVACSFIIDSVVRSHCAVFSCAAQIKTNSSYSVSFYHYSSWIADSPHVSSWCFLQLLLPVACHTLMSLSFSCSFSAFFLLSACFVMGHFGPHHTFPTCFLPLLNVSFSLDLFTPFSFMGCSYCHSHLHPAPSCVAVGLKQVIVMNRCVISVETSLRSGMSCALFKALLVCMQPG
ncbi:hypothetical protein XENOCAPTIV_028071 [Xenoophorus captivus]|uniref:Prominin 1 b n=1 Tax=Xenoophorus captivus TaxID=1517983 RepID=A0ABV0RVJ1_9TELE